MKLVGHSIHTEETSAVFPFSQGALFDYIFAADGVYIHGKRNDLEVCFAVSSHEVRGLAPGNEAFRFDLPKVPELLICRLQSISAKFAGEKLETLFHLVYSPVSPWNRGWELIEPEQERTAKTCRPLDDGPGSSYDRAVIEIHSHHMMDAVFSPTDDAEEQGFRLYGVIGRLNDQPEIRLRVGVFGHFGEIPADWVMELPDGLTCCVDAEERVAQEVDSWLSAEWGQRVLPGRLLLTGGF